MRRRDRIVWGVGLLLGVWTAAGAAGPGTTGADILKAFRGARAAGLAGASVYLAGDVQTLLYNPSGLAALNKLNASFQHDFSLDEVGYEWVACAQPVEEYGTLGGALLWRHLPMIDNPGASDAPVRAQDFVLQAGIGQRIGRWISLGGGFWEDVAAGISAKLIYLTLGEETAAGAALDAGARWDAPAGWNVPASLGVSVQNFGMPLRFREQADPLPLLLRVSAGCAPYADERQQARIAAEAVWETDNPVKTSLGAEYVFRGLLFLRLGYRWETLENLQGPAAGLGIAVSVSGLETRLDYAYQPVLWNGWESVGNEHFFSLGVSF